MHSGIALAHREGSKVDLARPDNLNSLVIISLGRGLSRQENVESESSTEGTEQLTRKLHKVTKCIHNILGQHVHVHVSEHCTCTHIHACLSVSAVIFNCQGS